MKLIFLIIFFCLVNIGQNNPGNNNTPTVSTASSQTSGTNPIQQSTAIPTATNIPGVAAGNLDFSNFARSLGSMVQGITGRFMPGATFVNPNSATTPSATSNTTPSTQNSNTATGTTTNNNETDTVTEQMLGGIIFFREWISLQFIIFFVELLRLLGGGIDNPELDNLTIGSFMQRFGEDVESRSNDGKNSSIKQILTKTISSLFRY